MAARPDSCPANPPRKVPRKSILKKTVSCPSTAPAEGHGGDERWILPTPAKAGDYLEGSHKVPNKSILKRTSTEHAPTVQTSSTSSDWDDSSLERLSRDMASLKTLCADANDGIEEADRTTRMNIHLATSKTKKRASVVFASVTVREYDRIVGDNPSCRSGPPVSALKVLISFDFSIFRRHLSHFLAPTSSLSTGASPLNTPAIWRTTSWSGAGTA